jgi:hypothetical protein
VLELSGSREAKLDNLRPLTWNSHRLSGWKRPRRASGRRSKVICALLPTRYLRFGPREQDTATLLDEDYLILSTHARGNKSWSRSHRDIRRVSVFSRSSHLTLPRLLAAKKRRGWIKRRWNLARVMATPRTRRSSRNIELLTTLETNLEMALSKIVYTAHATVIGGRDGVARSDDGNLDVKLQPPKEMGGSGKGTNPDTLPDCGGLNSRAKPLLRRRSFSALELKARKALVLTSRSKSISPIWTFLKPKRWSTKLIRFAPIPTPRVETLMSLYL